MLPFIASLAIVVALVGIYIINNAQANASAFITKASATATTTLSYMTPGTATSTLSFDALSGPSQTAFDSANLNICYNASSTASVLNTALEYSPDGTTWFQNNLNALASTSPLATIQSAQSFAWPFASSTIGGQPVVPLLGYVCKTVEVRTPQRYVRAVFSITGANAGIWAQFVGKRENQ